MLPALQGSLLDLTGPADGSGESGQSGRPASGPTYGSLTAAALGGPRIRHELGLGAWIDVVPGWLTGADLLLDRLLSAVPWHAERRQMYDATVDVPRLTKFYAAGESLPDPSLREARERLDEAYEPETGERFATTGLCLYRDGRDSVAWHGDRAGRSRDADTTIAILSLGSPRVLAFRRRDGGPTLARWALGHGDLVVMGGTCQRTMDHAVPKTSKPVGPRVSIQFRVAGVR